MYPVLLLLFFFFYLIFLISIYFWHRSPTSTCLNHATTSEHTLRANLTE
jgi:hypothetical protein